VHLFRSRPRFLAEAQPRLKTGEDNRQFLAEVHILFFRRSHELQSKRHHWKNYKFIFKYVYKFINSYILTIFYSIFYQLGNKTNLLNLR
jgi:hypothetical protein